MNQPKYRRPLNPTQIQLLTCLYKFRFASTALLTSQQHITNSAIQERLNILVEQEYIGRHYDSSHKIIGKHARYYLLPKAIQFLKQQSFASPKAIKSLYYDRRATDDKQAHALNVFAVYNAINQLYANTFKFYSKTELIDRSYLTRNKPDALLSLANPVKGQANDFILDSYETAERYWTMRRKIRSYIIYAESERWRKATRRPQPAFLMVCETKAIQTSLMKLVRLELETTYVNAIFLAITLDSLVSADSLDDITWKPVLESEAAVVLVEPFIRNSR